MCPSHYLIQMLFMFNHEVYLQLFHVVKLEQLKEEWNESVKVQFSNSLLLINAIRYIGWSYFMIQLIFVEISAVWSIRCPKYLSEKTHFGSIWLKLMMFVVYHALMPKCIYNNMNWPCKTYFKNSFSHVWRRPEVLHHFNFLCLKQ